MGGLHRSPQSGLEETYFSDSMHPTRQGREVLSKRLAEQLIQWEGSQSLHQHQAPPIDALTIERIGEIPSLPAPRSVTWRAQSAHGQLSTLNSRRSQHPSLLAEGRESLTPASQHGEELLPRPNWGPLRLPVREQAIKREELTVHRSLSEDSYLYNRSFFTVEPILITAGMAELVP